MVQARRVDRGDAKSTARNGGLRSMGSVRLCLLLAIAGFSAATGSGAERVYDLRHPGRGSARFSILPSCGFVECAQNIGQWPQFVGDVDGDGQDDFIVSVPRQGGPDPADRDVGDAVLVFGRRDDPSEGAPEIDAVRSVRFHGDLETRSNSILDSFAGLGDLDGDGFDEFAIGLPFRTWDGIPSVGVVFVVYGAGEFPSDVSLADIEASSLRVATVVLSDPVRRLSRNIQSGDIDGDGTRDLFLGVGAFGTENGEWGAGQMFAVFGDAIMAGQTVDLADWATSAAGRGFVLRGAYGRGGGRTVGDATGSGSGTVDGSRDIDGDGVADLVVGGSGVQNGRGAVYVLSGGPHLRERSELRAATPGPGFAEILGPTSNSTFGRVVAHLGDVDGDGLSDPPGRFPSLKTRPGSSSGVESGRSRSSSRIRTCARFGSRVGLRPARWGSPSRGSGGEVRPALSATGTSMSFADFAVSVPLRMVRHGANTGEAYIVLGGPQLSGARARIEQVGTDALPGLVIRGRDARLWTGATLAGGGDFDGDGRDDFLMNAPFSADLPRPEDDDEASLLYVFFGGGEAGRDLELLAVEPPEASTAGGDEVRVFGGGFTGEERVFVGGAQALVLEAVTTAELHVEVPASARSGPALVEIEGKDGMRVSLEDGLEYVAPRLFGDLVLDPKLAAGLSGPSRARLPRHGVRGSLASAFGSSSRSSRAISTVTASTISFVGEATGGPERRGRFAVVFGRPELPAEIGLGETGSHGFLIHPQSRHLSIGGWLELLGDVDGDGLHRPGDRRRDGGFRASGERRTSCTGGRARIGRVTSCGWTTRSRPGARWRFATARAASPAWRDRATWAETASPIW